MANMGYCRWQNTLGDLQDCEENWEKELSEEEASAKRELLELAWDLLERSGFTVEPGPNWNN